MLARRDDVTIIGGWGGVEKGWNAQVEKRYDWASARFATDDDERRIENISTVVSSEMAYLVDIERTRIRLAGTQEVRPMALRVTSSFSTGGRTMEARAPARRPSGRGAAGGIDRSEIKSPLRLKRQAHVDHLKPAGNDLLLQMWPLSKRVNDSKAPADDATRRPGRRRRGTGSEWLSAGLVAAVAAAADNPAVTTDAGREVRALVAVLRRRRQLTDVGSLIHSPVPVDLAWSKLRAKKY